MKRTYNLQKTDAICDIDQVLCVLRLVPGVASAVLLEEKSRVVIDAEQSISLDMLNAALAEKVPCRLEDEQVQPE